MRDNQDELERTKQITDMAPTAKELEKLAERIKLLDLPPAKKESSEAR